MPVKKTVSKYPLDWSGNAGLLQAAKGFALEIDEDGYIKAIASIPFTSSSGSGVTTNCGITSIADPVNSPGAVNPSARCFGNQSHTIADSAVGLVSDARKSYFSPVYANQWLAELKCFASRQVSGVHVAKVINIFAVAAGLPQYTSECFRESLDILMVCSAGTATLTVEASADSTNWLNIDTIAAAATTVKHYDSTVVGGGTVALCPLGFPYIRVTAGDAGVGNTTTTTVVAK